MHARGSRGERVGQFFLLRLHRFIFKDGVDVEKGVPAALMHGS